MKTNLLKAFALALVMMTCYNCSVEPIDNSQNVSEVQEIAISQQASAMNCNGANPKARIANNGTLPLNFQIFDISGSLIHEVQGIVPGAVTEWSSFAAGNVIFNITIDSHSDQKVVFNMETCTELILETDANNQLVEGQPQASIN